MSSAVAESPASSPLICSNGIGGAVLPRSASTNARISALWPFVLRPARARDLFASVAHEFEPPKIFEDRDRAATENFNALLRCRLVAIREIADRAQRAVRKLERRNDVIQAVLPGIAHGLRLHFRRTRAREKAEKIDEMAQLRRECARLPARDRSPNDRQECNPHSLDSGWPAARGSPTRKFSSARHGRESTIETDHEAAEHFVAAATRTTEANSSSFRQSGFSQKTAFPARSAASAWLA